MDTKSYNYQKSDSPRNKKIFVFIILSCLMLTANVTNAQVSYQRFDLPENTQRVGEIRAKTIEEATGFSLIETHLSEVYDYRLFKITQDGILSFKDEYIPNFEKPRNLYGMVDTSSDQKYLVWVKASKHTASESIEVTVTITDANDAPSITLPTQVFIGLEENIKVVKSGIPTHDPDGDNNLTFSLSEVDYKLFEITQDGTLSFKDEYIPNFEKPRNSEGVVDINADVSYLVRVFVTDPSGLRSVGTLFAIVISDVNEAPVITLNNSEPEYPLNILENRQFVVEVTATDEDEGDSITYSLSEEHDAFLFNITQSGILIFKPEFIPDYEMPRNSQGVIDTSLDQGYWVRVKVSSKGNLSDTQLIKVNILDDVSDNAMSNKDFEKIGLSVWPNPTTGDILNITVKEKAEYKLLNIRGQVLKIGNLTSGESKIDVSTLSKGVYFLNFKTISGSFTRKIVKN